MTYTREIMNDDKYNVIYNHKLLILQVKWWYRRKFMHLEKMQVIASFNSTLEEMKVVAESLTFKH